MRRGARRGVWAGGRGALCSCARHSRPPPPSHPPHRRAAATTGRRTRRARLSRASGGRGRGRGRAARERRGAPRPGARPRLQQGRQGPGSRQKGERSVGRRQRGERGHSARLLLPSKSLARRRGRPQRGRERDEARVKVWVGAGRAGAGVREIAQPHGRRPSADIPRPSLAAAPAVEHQQRGRRAKRKLGLRRRPGRERVEAGGGGGQDPARPAAHAARAAPAPPSRSALHSALVQRRWSRVAGR